MSQETLKFAQEQVAQGRRVALVTVTETSGSSPASVGQLMAVAEDGQAVGTVGGGMTEHLVTRQAVAAIQGGQRFFRFSFDHAENGMVCGGDMQGFGNILGSENHLYLFGGGHVGQSLAKLALLTGFFVTVVEDRPEFEQVFSGAFSGVRYRLCRPQDYGQKIALPRSAFAVICTRGHATDDEALRFCLSNPPRYIGMIGSVKKVEALFTRLRAEGVPEEALGSIYTPVGLDVASAVPAEIAVAVMAEILLIKNGGTLNHKRSLKPAPPCGQ